jgi:hypothetical protein
MKIFCIFIVENKIVYYLIKNNLFQINSAEEDKKQKEENKGLNNLKTST